MDLNLGPISSMYVSSVPKRYDVKECALRDVYGVNQKFKDRNWMDASMYSNMYIS